MHPVRKRLEKGVSGPLYQFCHQIFKDFRIKPKKSIVEVMITKEKYIQFYDERTKNALSIELALGVTKQAI